MARESGTGVPFFALVGLGNPGEVYLNNRHNVGFGVIDALAAEYASTMRFRNMASLAEVLILDFENSRLLLAKPTTFMNLSGRAVKFLADFYKFPGDNLYVFHDDLDLPFPRIKVKKGGGNGGHNGLRSIDATFGQNYWRVRIGIGRPAYKSMVSDYVLGNFEVEQRATLSEILQSIPKNLSTLLREPQKFQKFYENTGAP
ncbi:MAG: aminoacyl-tRNA hydrolase [Holosporaceae bacterium]|jgi:PTH1 family peptidyl-tRNA hydrolase|nr:aminoacyl-tRNA hydrolase [Holosporaceae bacterium]